MEAAHNHQGGRRELYTRLLLMSALSFVAMYALMYAMVDRLGNVVPNLNQAYMAALMAAPMVAIELALMRSMYPSAKLNAVALGVSAVVLAASFLFIRQQVAIGDREFLKSMIPHHAGAILMCEQASIRDAEIEALCATIIEGQRAEIDQMKDILERLE